MSLDAFHSLDLLIGWGVDEALSETPVDRFQARPKPALTSSLPQAAQQLTAVPPPLYLGLEEALADAQRIAAACATIDDLREALIAFDGHSLRRTAKTMIFEDGVRGARVMVVGEVPDTAEDRAGKPFAGQEGILFDRMLGSIGLSRAEDAGADARIYVGHLIHWRPPGGRSVNEAEVAVSLPFLKRHIALANPDILVIAGEMAARALLETKEPITRLRGNFVDYDTGVRTIKAMPFLHPKHLVATPPHKAMAWTDLQMIRDALKQA